jgi:hypothetical protein
MSDAAVPRDGLHALLQAYSLSALQTMSKFANLGIESPEKNAYIQPLAERFANPETIVAAAQQLDGLERLALEQMLSQGGEARTDLLKQELLRSGFVEDSPAGAYQGSPYRRAPRYFEDALAHLTALGLVLTAGGPDQTLELSPGPRLLIPEAARKHLPPTLQWAQPLAEERLSTVNKAAPEAFQRDLFLSWSYVNRNEVVLTARGLLPKRHWTRLNAELWVKESGPTAHEEGGRLSFLQLLMEEMGMLERAGLRLRPSPTSRDLLGLSLRARSERTFRAWMRTSAWNELLRIHELRIDTAANQNRRATAVVKGGRQFVVGLLQHTPPEQWVSISDLLGRAKEINYEFLFPRHHNYYGLHNPYHSYNNPLSWEFPVYDETQGWDIVEARFITSILQEPLHWLGLVSLGWEGTRLTAFQVSRLGAQILGVIAPEPETPPERRLIIQPNFEVLALDPVSDYALATLDEFAERLKSERVFQYRLSRESVYLAQQRGMTAQAIIAFLDRESSTPMPQNVRLSLQEWGRYHERITFFQGGLICQVADAAMLDNLLADPALAPLLGRRIAPTATLIVGGKGALQQVQRALQNNHLLPAITPPPAELPALTIAPDGRVHFRHRVPDIYLRHKLSPFCEARGEELYLTSRAVAKAVAQGWTAENIIAALQPLHQGPLSPALATQIKTWGGYYGNASVKHVTLLELKNDEVLRELADDPIIGPLIVPFQPSGALAIIREEDMDRLREALEQRGMEVESPRWSD